MIESPAAVSHIDEIVAVADFVSIGTNDLAATTLGVVRGLRRIGGGRSRPRRHAPGGPRGRGRPPGIDRGRGVRRGRGDPRRQRTLVGLGVTELSVGSVRLAAVREAVRSNRDRPIASGDRQGRTRRDERFGGTHGATARRCPLHARPAARIVKEASRHDAIVTITVDNGRANARSILELLAAGSRKRRPTGGVGVGIGGRRRGRRGHRHDRRPRRPPRRPGSGAG